MEELGYDSAYVMIDADDDIRTGTNVFGEIGIDYVVVIAGKHNEIISSQLFEFDLSQGSEPWSYIGEIDSAIDWYRLELAIDPASMGIAEGGNFTIHASMEDWNHAYDVSDSSVDLTAINVEDSTRAPKPPRPRLTIVKTGPATAGPGDTITYTIVITNPSKKVPAYDVAVTESYPADVIYVGASPAPSSGDNVWDLGTLGPEESVTISITVTVGLTVLNGDMLTNTAEVSYTDGASGLFTRSDSADTDIVIIPEMQNLAIPIGGIFLIIIIFNNRRSLPKKRREDGTDN